MVFGMEYGDESDTLVPSYAILNTSYVRSAACNAKLDAYNAAALL